MSARNAAETHPLTLPQLEVWKHQALFPRSCVWTIGGAIRIEGPLEWERFCGAARDVVDQADALRLRVGGEGGEVRQHAGDFPPFATELHEVADEAGLATALSSRMGQRFRLEEGERPVTFDVFRLHERHHVLLARFHHVACDGWGASLVFQRLVARYNRPGGPLEEVPAFLAQIANAGEPAGEMRVARGAEEGAPDLAWPEAGGTVGPAAVTFLSLEPERVRDLEMAARQAHAATFTLFLAALARAFQKWRGAATSAIPIACPVLNRRTAVLRRTVGHFARLAAFPVAPEAGGDLAALHHRVRGLLRACERETAGHGVAADLFLSFENHDYAHAFEGCATRCEPVLKAEQQRPVEIFVRQYNAALPVRIDFAYRADLISEAEARRLVELFDEALTSAVAAPAPAWYGACGRVGEVGASASFLEAGVRQFGARGSRLAIASADRSISYAELEKWVARATAHLAGRGVRAGEVVGIAVPRSPELVAALLGILGNGAAYLPLDPQYPWERLALMLEEAAPGHVIAEGEMLDRLRRARPEGSVISLAEIFADAPKAAPVSLGWKPESMAYVLFTSGSTGQPKGIRVSHRALANCLASLAVEPGFAAEDRMAWLTSLSFDIAAAEVFLPLACGGALRIMSDEEVRDPRCLARRLEDSAVTVAQATPTLWRLLAAAGWRPHAGLRIWSGGEVLPRQTARWLLQHARQVWNCYGPTETTIWSLVGRLQSPEANRIIGQPLANTWISVRDPAGAPLPDGQPGELWIGGAGVSAGYLGGDSRQRFVEAAFPDGSVGKAFRTGDRALRQADGNLEFLGRLDRQVKLSGQRVEPEEVERVLLAVPGVADALCEPMRHPAGELRLVAYVVPAADHSAGTGEIVRACAEAVRQRLPSAARPDAVMALQEIPRSPGGKLDPLRLPRPRAWSRSHAARQDSQLEHQLAAIWSEILHIPPPDRQATLAQLGADSLATLHFVLRAEELGLLLRLADLSPAATIASFAPTVRRSRPRKATYGWRLDATARHLNSLCPEVPASHHNPGEFPLAGVTQDALNELVPWPGVAEDLIRRDDLPAARTDPLWKPVVFARTLPFRPDERKALQAWRRVAYHHPVVRSSFIIRESSWFQRIDPELPTGLDLRLSRPDSLAQDSPGGIVATLDGQPPAARLILTFPAFLLDQPSAQILADDWWAVCSEKTDQPPWRPPRRAPYRDYVAALRRMGNPQHAGLLPPLANWDLVP